MWRDPISVQSVRDHAVSDEDMLHAYRNPVRIFELDEGFTLIVGPSRAALSLQIGVVEGDTAPVIVHAMHARQKFLR